MEIALKLQETTYIGAKGFSGADFVHGPLAMVEPGMPAFVIAPPGRGSASMTNLMDRLAAEKADTLVVSSEPIFGEGTHKYIPVPLEVPEVLSPIPYIIVGQLFAYHLATAKGNNPDAPRGLTKVTSTI
jgi:glucosamine--fructose-6-phosphate aminotransferase (isomerizing)